MSRSTARRWLWLAALVTMPVPFYLGEVEWAPVLRLGFLSALFAAVMLAEGGTTAILIGLMGIGQTLAYGGLFFVAADLAARGAARIGSPLLRTAAVGSLVLVLFTASQLPIYETPLSSTRLRSNLWQIFE